MEDRLTFPHPFAAPKVEAGKHVGCALVGWPAYPQGRNINETRRIDKARPLSIPTAMPQPRP